jgi:hypothetical protein
MRGGDARAAAATAAGARVARRSRASLAVRQAPTVPCKKHWAVTILVMELIGNRAIENAAIAWVIELEREEGREPIDSRHSGGAADIVSPPRVIEVKAVGKQSCRGEDLWLETRQVEEARHNPDFWLYVVENVRQADPTRFTVKRIGGDRLQRLLSRAREKHYYEVPWPVADYDSDR